MDVELVTDETSEDENYGLDDNNEEYFNFEGERCGICMDIVVDRGVLDCCHHWFCFSCIDNWATITSLCPLCQHEFQMITCVPVYDTIGGNKSDEDTGPRDEDWLVEGKNNTLSFPSYYIDENSVVCLEGDGCQVRSGSAAIDENSDIDTSIACDSCDKWFHAFCVGFDAEGTCYGSWLCPRCSTDGGAQKSDVASGSGKSSDNSLDITNGDGVAETSFSGRVSVSIAGDGETAVVVSLVDEDKRSLETSESVMDCSKDMNNSTPLFINNMLNSGTIVDDRITIETNPSYQDVVIKSRDDSCSSLHSFSLVQPKIDADFAVERANIFSENRLLGSCIDPALLSPIRSYMPDMENNGATEDRVPASDECHSPAENMVHSLESMVPDEEESEYGNTGGKRKCTDISSKGDSFRDVDAGEAEAEAGNDPKISRKKIKAERNSRPIIKMDEAAQSVAVDSFTIPSSDTSNNSIPKQNSIPNITDIIRETDKKSLKKHKRPISSLMNPEEREMAAGFRLKKIMRRGGDDDKDSSALVQEIRKTIREAIRNKSSEELGQNLFDPKLLDAFRAALASSGTENRKPTLDLKAKSLLLQKGKVRESLTKKIYGSGGKRKRAWTRECEVEFWKHRCAKATKPEKVQALKSVLDLLRENTDGTKEKPVNENEGKGSILSRLYLADTSVFPRKNDIKPVSAVEIATEQNQKSGSSDKFSKLLTGDSSQRKPPNSSNLLQANVTVSHGKELKGSIKAEVSHGDADKKKHLKGTSNSLLSGNKASSEKETESKPDVKKNDRRKWALELLARKSATSNENIQEKEEDNAILKGKYTLLAQLPKDMRPVLAPSCHDKISMSIRQAQLYRLTEHFLKKANLSVVCRSAEIELAVADAVNIEKQVADKSNSKLVYVNLCSQELLRRSDGVKVDGAKEVDPCSASEYLSEETAPVDTNTSPVDLQVDEALRNAGLMSDSPPNSPLIHRTTEAYNIAGSPGKVEDDDPEDIFKVDTRSEFDIYGDFEYNFDDDDDHIIRLGPPKVSDTQSEQPKIKLLFSSLMPEKPDERSDLQDHVSVNNEAALDNSAETKDQTSAGVISLNSKLDDCVIQNSSANKDDGLSLAECEELYGPDKQPLMEKYPDSISSIPVNSVLPEQKSNDLEKNPDNSGHAGDASKQSPSNSHKKEKANKKDKTTKGGRSQSEPNSSVMKKVEAYIKEHIRPLCKSGVITVEQYRWAVGKATEKVMKYHSKETNANFLIKEGEKVKKLAEQYVEASQKGKS